MLSGFKYLLSLNLVALEIMHDLHLLLVERQYHVFISVLNLSHSFDNLNNDISDIFIIFQSQAYYFLRAYHVQLIDTSLTHLTLHIIVVDLLSVGKILFFLTSLLPQTILTLGKLFHHLLKLCVEVGGQISIDLSLHLLVRSFCEQMLLVQHPDLVIDLSDVLEFICIYSLIGGLWHRIVIDTVTFIR